MMKKRICLIGVEVSSVAGPQVQLSKERVGQVSTWAERNGFDGVWVVTSSCGLIEPAEFKGEAERSLAAMSKRERSTWATSICNQVATICGPAAKVREFVLLANIVGYQELADNLLALRSGMVLTMPLGGTKIVPVAREIESGCAVGV